MDFGRSIATTIAGIVGLICYLFSRDWVIAAFSAVIIFPVIRITATSLHKRIVQKADRIHTVEDAKRIVNDLSDGEKEVLVEFVKAEGCVLTWGHINRLNIQHASIESLIQREILWTSITADGMTETFVLDSKIFDAARRLDLKVDTSF